MTADQRRAVNRYNARKSTGPNTPEGKERTRQNALKHGLCATMLALSIEDPDALQDQFDEWVMHHQPVGPAEFAMVEEIAVAQLRLRRCRIREAALLERQIHAAEEAWNHEQNDRVRAALRRLVTDPAALADVRGSGVGRRWMIDRWMQIDEALLRDRYASAPALVDDGVRLLGGDPAQPAAGPLSAYEFRLACAGARSNPDPNVLAWLVSDGVIHPDYLAEHGRVIPECAACRDRVEQLIAAESAALEQAENDGQEDERGEFDDACFRAQVPSDSPDTKLSLRYEALARAALHKALKALDQLQDARYAAEAEAETGGMPTSAWACAGAADAAAADMPTQTWACHPETPLPSIARNEPEPPPESQSSADSQTSCNSSTEANPAEAATATLAVEEVAEVIAAATTEIDATILPVVTPEMADSPPA